MPDYLILGSGFTGSRVARRLRERGLPVIEIRREHIDFTQPGSAERLEQVAPAGCVVLHSIPCLPHRADARLLDCLHGKAGRVVYLSTTSVYGTAREVDESTPISPQSLKAVARVQTEEAVLKGPWEALIIRPAAIYGPGRGVQVSMLQRRFRLLGDGSNFISRIYVDDLARLAEAALLSDLTGAYPVADSHPCSSVEIAEYCARLFSLPMPERCGLEEVPESRRANRRVDGTAICRLLGVQLAFPSYLEGIPAALREDRVNWDQPR